MTFSAENNYTFTLAIDISPIELAAGTDFSIDWSALTLDLRGRTVDPALVDTVTISRFGLEQEEIEQQVADDELSQAAVESYFQFLNVDGSTAADASGFSIIGNNFAPATDFVEDDEATWLVSLISTGGSRALDILISKFVVPSASATTTEVSFTNDCSTIDFTSDLGSATPLRTSAGLDSYTLDWSGLENTASNKPYEILDGDQMFIVQTGLDTVEEVETELLRMFEIAENTWYLSSYGVTFADLMTAEADDGSLFPGFSTDGGVWIIGVECTECTSPAPMFLGVVEVVE